MFASFTIIWISACTGHGSQYDPEPCGGHVALSENLFELARLECEFIDSCFEDPTEDPDNAQCIETFSGNYNSYLIRKDLTYCVDYCAVSDILDSMPNRDCSEGSVQLQLLAFYECDSRNYPDESLPYPP